jgi:hypothetical protein
MAAIEMVKMEWPGCRFACQGVALLSCDLQQKLRVTFPRLAARIGAGMGTS